MRTKMMLALILILFSGGPSGTSDSTVSICKFVAPKYSPIARQAWIQGDVILKVVAAPDGSINQVDAVSGNGILAETAINAVKSWRLCADSLLTSGHELTMTFRFRLDGNGTDNWAPTDVKLEFPKVVQITTSPPAPLGPDVIEKK
jgi:hypothetical protein